MANTFKSHGELNVGTSYVDMYTVTSGVTVILGLALCNKSANPVTVSVQWEDANSHTTAGEDYGLLEAVSIPAKTTLEVLAGQKYILETSDKLRVKAGATSSIDATLGIMEIT